LAASLPISHIAQITIAARHGAEESWIKLVSKELSMNSTTTPSIISPSELNVHRSLLLISNQARAIRAPPFTFWQ
jgi:hypothetical protein